jgi:predicted hydrocarbon binding protein
MRLVSTHAAETALRTSMIGSLDRIEQKFGHLWGHNKNEDELTDEDEDMYEIYMELREEILDYGNEQICKLKGIQWKKKQ